MDAGVEDAGIEDAGIEDAGIEDAGIEDAGIEDAGIEDAGIEDAGIEDAGIEDAGIEDAGIEDAGIEDAGIEDAGVADAGCSTGLLCGAGACCPSGTECLDGLCQTSCSSGVSCGANASLCCSAGELCVNDVCSTPTADTCVDSVDCAPTHRCEPSLGRCVAGPGTLSCELRPAPGPMAPVLEWAWNSSPVHPASLQVTSMPLVVDLENDGLTDVVIITLDTPGAGYLRALDGRTGAEKWGAGTDALEFANRVNSAGTAAAADLDGDGQVEVIAHAANGGLLAFNSDGSLRWSATLPDAGTWTATLHSPAVSVADLDGDGNPELAVGGLLFDRSGQLILDKGATAGGHSGLGPISTLAELDEQGPSVLITGSRAWDLDGGERWDGGSSDGYSAVADFDGVSGPEVVVVFNGALRVHSGSTGELLDQVSLATGSAGGPPAIADFDGDQLPDIAVSAGNAISVYRFVTGALSPLWSSPIQDQGSRRTPATAFDFDGDGRAELVFNDECTFRIYDGLTGAVLFDTPNSATTVHEYPVIADVDGDDHAEVLVPASNSNCGSEPNRQGLYVYGDPRWPRARRIWNQQNYQGAHISGDGRVPAIARRNWTSWRQASAGGGAFDEADLRVSLTANQVACPTSLRLEARVHNRGSRAAPAGVQVQFFLGSTLVDTVTTPGVLLPGHSVVLSTDAMPVSGTFRVVVDEDESVAECGETDNEASVIGSCP